MPHSRALEGLYRQQSDILDIMRGAEAMLCDTCDVAGLARQRWALMRALTAYQLFKHREIFDPALAQATPATAHRLVRMKRACLDLGDAFRGHVQRWSGSDVKAQWATYQPSALAIITRIRAHIAREREEISALLAKAA